MLLGDLALDASPAIGALGKLDAKFSDVMGKGDHLKGLADFASPGVASLLSFKEKISEAGQNIKGLGAGGIAAFAGLGAAVVAAGIVVAGLAAGFEVLKFSIEAMSQSLEFASKLKDTSIRTGETAGALTILGEAFKEAGIGADGAEAFLLKFQDAISGVNEEGNSTAGALEALGTSGEKLRGLDSLGQIAELQRGFAGLADQTQKVQVARDLFGKSGGMALSLLGDASAMDIARAKAGPLAELMDNNIDAFDNLGDSIGALKMDFLEFGSGALSMIAPQLGSLVDAFSSIDFVGIGEGFGHIASKVLSILEPLKALVPAINAISMGLSTAFGSGSSPGAGFASKFQGSEKPGAFAQVGAFDPNKPDKEPEGALQKIGRGGYGTLLGVSSQGKPEFVEAQKQTTLLQRLVDLTVGNSTGSATALDTPEV